MNSVSENSVNPTAPEVIVSIIIVSWNARDYLMQCLASITPRSCKYPFEIIVVDNGSSDESPECVERSFPYVRLLRNKSNLGFAKANNMGISLSTGRYLCLVNSDVKVQDECITRLVDFCMEHPEVGLVGPTITGGDGKLQRSCRGFPSVWNMFCRALALDSLFPRVKAFSGYSLSHWSQTDQRSVDILTGCFWLAPRDALKHVGLLDESFFIYGEDMDWCRRFRRCGLQVFFVPDAMAIHYGGASSSNAPLRFYIERHRADLHYWTKHHSRIGTACFYVLCCFHQLARAIGYALAPLFSSVSPEACQYKSQRSVTCLKWLLTTGVRPGNWTNSGHSESCT